MRKRSVSLSNLIVPLLALLLIVVFNIIRDPSFFAVKLLLNNDGNHVLSGNLISILNGASELAVLAMGMTLVTAASGGQDISVGAAAAIAGSVFVKILRGGDVDLPLILVAFLTCCVVTMLFGAFNGTLVSVFKIQPMIATLILFTAGRSIAYWVNGGATPTVSGEWLGYLGGFIPGISVPTPIFIVMICGVLFWLLLKFTNLRLYTQALGINEKSTRLNGINTTWIKMLSFIILAVCVAIAGAIRVCRLGLINHETILLDIEMDAILAVAIGGNALGGGKFSMVGSVIGAYIIQALTTTLYAMKVPSNAVKSYKALVIIALVVIGSPIVKRYAALLRDKLFKGNPKKAEGV
ncbi:MAG: ABC transporter permease [Oscillospiraceae bacterium]|jgi:simple sugar transport system permease protein|nr:ABC transporter permease [Oscillospiraceae bacterium]